MLFVVGSRIAGVVEPGDEARFFEGYGPVEVDPEALAHYRYERVIEDIGGMAARVLLNPALSEQARAELAELVVGNLASGGPIDRAETVTVHRTPTAPAS